MRLLYLFLGLAALVLLSFFILTTKFKPSEAVTVETPHSVASKIAPEKDVVMVTLNKDGKVFLSTGDISYSTGDISSPTGNKVLPASDITSN